MTLTFDLWPWKSIGFQILLKTKYVPRLVKIHWRMLILVFTRMLRKDGRTEGWKDGCKGYYIPSQLRWRGDKQIHLTSLIETPSWKVIFDCFDYQYTILKFDFCNYWFVTVKSNYLALNITDEPIICFNMKIYLIWKDFSSYLWWNYTGQS